MPDEIQYGNGDTYTATFALTVLLDKIYTRDDSSKFWTYVLSKSVNRDNHTQEWAAESHKYQCIDPAVLPLCI